VRARLERAGVDSQTLACFDDAALERIAARAEGLPARVHKEADEILRRATPIGPWRARSPATREPGAERARRARRKPAAKGSRLGLALIAKKTTAARAPDPKPKPSEPLPRPAGLDAKPRRVPGPEPKPLEPAAAPALDAKPTPAPALEPTPPMPPAASPAPAPEPKRPVPALPPAAVPPPAVDAEPSRPPPALQVGRATTLRRELGRLAAAFLVGALVSWAIALLVLERPDAPPSPTPDVASPPPDAAPVEPDRTALGEPARRVEQAPPAAAPAEAKPPTIASVPSPPPPAAPAPEPRRILVSINAVPWARIEIDGEPMGETPLGDVPLPMGKHRIVARMADGRTLDRVVEVGESNRHLVFR
jgi:hypothetical protein